MKKLTRLFRSPDKPRDAVSSAPSFYFGFSASGKPVTPSSAVQVYAAYAYVRVIAETIASLLLYVYEATETSSRKAPEHLLMVGSPLGSDDAENHAYLHLQEVRQDV